MVKNVVVVNKR